MPEVELTFMENCALQRVALQDDTEGEVSCRLIRV